MAVLGLHQRRFRRLCGDLTALIFAVPQRRSALNVAIRLRFRNLLLPTFLEQPRGSLVFQATGYAPSPLVAGRIEASSVIC